MRILEIGIIAFHFKYSLFMDRWPSGLRRTPGKRVHGNVSGVQIPLYPPDKN